MSSEPEGFAFNFKDLFVLCVSLHQCPMHKIFFKCNIMVSVIRYFYTKVFATPNLGL